MKTRYQRPGWNEDDQRPHSDPITVDWALLLSEQQGLVEESAGCWEELRIVLQRRKTQVWGRHALSVLSSLWDDSILGWSHKTGFLLLYEMFLGSVDLTVLGPEFVAQSQPGSDAEQRKILEESREAKIRALQNWREAPNSGTFEALRKLLPTHLSNQLSSMDPTMLGSDVRYTEAVSELVVSDLAHSERQRTVTLAKLMLQSLYLKHTRNNRIEFRLNMVCCSLIFLPVNHDFFSFYLTQYRNWANLLLSGIGFAAQTSLTRFQAHSRKLLEALKQDFLTFKGPPMQLTLEDSQEGKLPTRVEQQLNASTGGGLITRFPSFPCEEHWPLLKRGFPMMEGAGHEFVTALRRACKEAVETEEWKHQYSKEGRGRPPGKRSRIFIFPSRYQSRWGFFGWRSPQASNSDRARMTLQTTSHLDFELPKGAVEELHRRSTKRLRQPAESHIRTQALEISAADLNAFAGCPLDVQVMNLQKHLRVVEYTGHARLPLSPLTQKHHPTVARPEAAAAVDRLVEDMKEHPFTSSSLHSVMEDEANETKDGDALVGSGKSVALYTLGPKQCAALAKGLNALERVTGAEHLSSGEYIWRCNSAIEQLQAMAAPLEELEEQTLELEASLCSLRAEDEQLVQNTMTQLEKEANDAELPEEGDGTTPSELIRYRLLRNCGLR